MKRLLCLALALVLALGLLPVGAAAAYGDRPIHIGSAEVDYVADEILKEIPTAGLTDAEKIAAVYDWVITHCQRDGWDGTYYVNEKAIEKDVRAYYDSATRMLESGEITLRLDLETYFLHPVRDRFFLSTDSQLYVATFAWEMMQTRTGTCAHFAALLAVLLGHLGYDCRLIEGDFVNLNGSRVEHKWNYVLVDGAYYWLDPRMDQAAYARTGAVSHQYFLVSDTDAWAKDHDWDHTYSDALAGGADRVAKLYLGVSELITPVEDTPWSQCSVWARDYMKRAYDAHLIPDALLNQDLTQPITREEFAAVSVLLYEQLSATPLPAPVQPSPFADTNDASVQKAYDAGIVKGVGGDRFDPDALLNREQAATMLGRVCERWRFGDVDDGSRLFTGPLPTLSDRKSVTFSDEADISDWAQNYIRYFVREGVIDGMGDGSFAPRSYMTREQALKIAVGICG